MRKVISNKGVAGVDGIKVEEEFDYLKENKARILNQIIKRRYKPQPVKSEKVANRVLASITKKIKFIKNINLYLHNIILYKNIV